MHNALRYEANRGAYATLLHVLGHRPSPVSVAVSIVSFDVLRRFSVQDCLAYSRFPHLVLWQLSCFPGSPLLFPIANTPVGGAHRGHLRRHGLESRHELLQLGQLRVELKLHLRTEGNVIPEA